jgi:hypothetical protein
MEGDGCGQIKYAIENADNLSEPIWRTTLSVIKFCSDGDIWAHELFKGDKRYSKKDTDEKLVTKFFAPSKKQKLLPSVVFQARMYPNNTHTVFFDNADYFSRVEYTNDKFNVTFMKDEDEKVPEALHNELFNKLKSILSSIAICEKIELHKAQLTVDDQPTRLKTLIDTSSTSGDKSMANIAGEKFYAICSIPKNVMKYTCNTYKLMSLIYRNQSNTPLFGLTVFNKYYDTLSTIFIELSLLCNKIKHILKENYIKQQQLGATALPVVTSVIQQGAKKNTNKLHPISNDSNTVFVNLINRFDIDYISFDFDN